jgi:hypothetical protein
MVARFLLSAGPATACLSAAPIASGHISFKNRSGLFRHCRPDAYFYSQGVFMGFVEGVANAMAVAKTADRALAGWCACITARVVVAQIGV